MSGTLQRIDNPVETDKTAGNVPDQLISQKPKDGAPSPANNS